MCAAYVLQTHSISLHSSTSLHSQHFLKLKQNRHHVFAISAIRCIWVGTVHIYYVFPIQHNLNIIYIRSIYLCYNFVIRIAKISDMTLFIIFNPSV